MRRRSTARLKERGYGPVAEAVMEASKERGNATAAVKRAQRTGSSPGVSPALKSARPTAGGQQARSQPCRAGNDPRLRARLSCRRAASAPAPPRCPMCRPTLPSPPSLLPAQICRFGAAEWARCAAAARRRGKHVPSWKKRARRPPRAAPIFKCPQFVAPSPPCPHVPDRIVLAENEIMAPLAILYGGGGHWNRL